MNKKGSTIIEAAVVLPLVILTVTAVISIIAFLNSEVTAQSKMHIALNAQMGEDTDTVITKSNVPKGQHIYKSKIGIFDVYIGETKVAFKKSGILKNNFVKNRKEQVYEVNEKKIIRYADFFEGVIKNE